LPILVNQASSVCFPLSIWDRGAAGDTRVKGCYIQTETLPKIYAALQSRNELAVIDPASARLLGRYPLRGARHPHGLAIAPGGAAGYIACDGNDRLLTVDLATGKVLDRQPLAHDPDVLAIDRKASRLYVASESGSLSTFDIRVAEHPAALGTVFVGKGAHALAVDPQSHRLYFALADLGGNSVLRVVAPREQARRGSHPALRQWAWR
jgi:DNA-binding beta-propeller fold protein YncE